MLRGDRLLEQLFLLEYLVEKVSFPSATCSCKQFDPLELRARIKFSDFPCVEIPSVGRGKSTMFSMAPLELAMQLDMRPLSVTLLTPSGRIVGAVRVPLETLSDSVRRAASCKTPLPDAESVRGKFRVLPTGSVVMSVRLSCFGPAVVTQFQMSGKRGRCLFRGSEADTKAVCPGPQPGYPTDRLPLPALLSSASRPGVAAPEEELMLAEPPDPKALAAKCDCDQLREKPREAPKPDFPEVPYFPLQEKPAPRLFHPRVRYDTTGKLSPAYQGEEPPPTVLHHPPVRYDTTGALSPAFRGVVIPLQWPLHPPVRYDTTGALSPAFQGKDPPGGVAPIKPPVRYDTTGALSPAFQFPRPRYDTTGALSSAFMSTFVPPPPEELEEQEYLPEEEPPPEEEQEEEAPEAEQQQDQPPPVEEEEQKPEEEEEKKPVPKAGSKASSAGSRKKPRAPKIRKQLPAGSPTSGAAPSPQETQLGVVKEEEAKEPPLALESEAPQSEEAVEQLKQLMEKVAAGAGGGRASARARRAAANRQRISSKRLAELSYPSMLERHEECLDSRPMVPRRMGWLWNLVDLGDNLRPRPYWRPGAVTRPVSKILRQHSKTPEPPRSTTTQSRRPRPGASQPSADVGPAGPTLVLTRKGRQYSLAVRPGPGPAVVTGAGDASVVTRAPPAEPFEFKLPRPSSTSSSYTVDTSSSSGLQVEFLAPAFFPAPRGPPQLRSRDTQCYVPGMELKPAVEEKGKADKKSKSSKKSKKSKKSK